MAPRRWAVAVVGGGPGGAATALALARRGVGEVVLFEATDDGADEGAAADAAAGPGARSPQPIVGESIPPAATPALRALGVLEAVDGGGHLPRPGSRSLWGGPEPGFNDFLFDPVGKGYHLDRRLFDAQLRRAARDAGVAVRGGTRVTALRRDEEGFELRTVGAASAEAVHRARFVVDASGARAWVARRLGVARNVLDRLVSVCAFADVPPGAFACDHTLLEAAEHGWWYAARLPGDRLIVSLTSDPATLRERGLGALAPWRRAFEDTRLVRREVDPALLDGVETLVARAAPVSILSAVVGPGWLAVGDAGSAYDPLGSAGITKALEHGVAAAGGIEARIEGGSGAASAEYQDRVFADFTAHVGLRRALYASERRWAGSPFWSARLRSPAPGPPKSAATTRRRGPLSPASPPGAPGSPRAR
ncbi:MAG TPA: tryptophan 7-halogenase, partial [Longimicrobiales bacterium]|nr:tryptophan 7-halogenase [Longimicrobiales bacterium]